MSASPKQQLDERIFKHTANIFAERGIAKQITPDDNLTDAGFSSLNMLNLMLAIESEFNIVVPQSDITTENFKSVASIRSMLERLLAESKSAV